MTSYTRTIYEPGAAPVMLGKRWPLWRFASERDDADRVLFPVTMLIVLGLYLLLQNPYWVPAGDSELYTTVARSLARGEGYKFNGQPVAMIPPGWALMMAGVMKITPYILPLKLLAMGCLVGSLACGYWIVRRFAPPKQTALVILLTAILSHVYQATYWLISEGSFCLAVSAGILVALQISEGRRAWWRAALVVLLCIAAVTIRWAGLLSMVLVVAALLDRQIRPRVNVQWITAGLAILLGAGTFFGFRHFLQPTAEQLALARDAIMGNGEDTGIGAEEPPVTGAANQTAKAYRLIPEGSFLGRFINWGRWFSWLYWQPLRAAAGSRLLGNISVLAGWILLGLVGVIVIVTSMQRRWLFAALGVYCGVLAIGWTNVNARYYVPVAFLITTAILLAAEQLKLWLAGTSRRAWVNAAAMTFVVSVFVCNGLLYGVEASVARSEHFAQRYETGLNMSLVSAAAYLRALEHPPGDGEVGVSMRYTNLNRSRPSPFALRVLALLSDRVVASPKFKITDVAPTSNYKDGKLLRSWMTRAGVKWYLYQPPISPWRVWHFRLGWYEKWVTGQSAAHDESSWHLYQIEMDRGGQESRLVEVRVPQVDRYPTRVPGL